MRAIDADALYERACELEAQALAYVGKIINDETKVEEWKIWSAILAERTAFKHDVFDAPTIEPEPHWIKCSERLPERGKDVLVTRDYDGREDFNKSCRYVEVASSYGEENAITWNSYSDEYKMTPKNHHVIAWMPLPEAYKEGEG